MDLPRIIAHRGAAGLAPENTLAAFRAAAAAGAIWVEFDVALTSDDRPVVFHDEILDRTTDGSGVLAETPFETVKHLDAGSWFSPVFTGELVPTLEETLETLADLSLGFNMEIKPTRGREQETARIALTTAAATWPAEAATPLISSFARTAVAVARDMQNQWPRSLLFDRRPLDWREIGKELALTAFSANAAHLDQAQIEEIIAAGLRLTAYTVNDVDRARTLFTWGVEAVYTDIPERLIAAFSDKQSPI